mgnify:CR=1 FL=1
MFGVGIPSLNMVVINIFKPTLAELSGLGGGGGIGGRMYGTGAGGGGGGGGPPFLSEIVYKGSFFLYKSNGRVLIS